MVGVAAVRTTVDVHSTIVEVTATTRVELGLALNLRLVWDHSEALRVWTLADGGLCTTAAQFAMLCFRYWQGTCWCAYLRIAFALTFGVVEALQTAWDVA